MREIKPANTYAARLVGQAAHAGADGKSFFKIYFVDIIGRSQPERYEWHACGRTRESFTAALAATSPEGVGFVIAFPHITKVFRFSPDAETVLDVKAYRTDALAPLALDRAEGFVEFACLAEALIAAEEYDAWARSESVEEYKGFVADFSEGTVVDNRKLLKHWAGR